MADPNYQFLVAEFLVAMNDIGQYGSEKYGEDSFQARQLKGDSSRGPMIRTQAHVIAAHAMNHFNDYLHETPHDHFGTMRHQLAAVAFNAMMEFYFSGLADGQPEKEAIK